MRKCPCDYRYLMDEFTIDCAAPIEKILFKLSYHAAETIDGIKPASLITLRGDHAKDYLVYEQTIKQIMPLSVVVLNQNEQRVILLVFNPKTLAAHISATENISYLVSLGYPAFNLATILSRLKNQFSSGCPTEIGIFLGYPVEDVKSFALKLSKPILTGYWNVYSDPHNAKLIFARFDRARHRIGQIFKSGISPSKYLLEIKTSKAI